MYGKRPMRSTLQSKGFYDQKSYLLCTWIYIPFILSLRWLLCSWKLIYPSVSVHTELTLWPESAKPCTFSAKVMEGTLMLPLPTVGIRLPLPKLFWHLSCCLSHAHNCDIPPSIPLFSCHGYIQLGIGTSAGPFCHCVVALFSWPLQCIWTNSQSCP